MERRESNLQPGQWSPCGGYATDCIVLEVEDAEAGTIRVSSTSRTWEGVVPGHEITDLVNAWNAGQVDPDIMRVIYADTERNRQLAD